MPERLSGKGGRSLEKGNDTDYEAVMLQGYNIWGSFHKPILPKISSSDGSLSMFTFLPTLPCTLVIFSKACPLFLVT